MFNPFEHFGELVHTNIDGGVLFDLPHKATIPLPDGQIIQTATGGHPETLTFWLKGADGRYGQITHDQEFVQGLWLHFKYAAPLGDWHSAGLDLLGLSHDYRITPDAMRAAVLNLPHVLADIANAGVTADQVWAYAQAEAPWAVEIVGVPPA